jgi:hypothetical protein
VGATVIRDVEVELLPVVDEVDVAAHDCFSSC